MTKWGIIHCPTLLSSLKLLEVRVWTKCLFYCGHGVGTHLSSETPSTNHCTAKTRLLFDTRIKTPIMKPVPIKTQRLDYVKRSRCTAGVWLLGFRLDFNQQYFRNNEPYNNNISRISCFYDSVVKSTKCLLC